MRSALERMISEVRAAAAMFGPTTNDAIVMILARAVRDAEFALASDMSKITAHIEPSIETPPKEYKNGIHESDDRAKTGDGPRSATS